MNAQHFFTDRGIPLRVCVGRDEGSGTSGQHWSGPFGLVAAPVGMPRAALTTVRAKVGADMLSRPVARLLSARQTARWPVPGCPACRVSSFSLLVELSRMAKDGTSND